MAGTLLISPITFPSTAIGGDIIKFPITVTASGGDVVNPKLHFEYTSGSLPMTAIYNKKRMAGGVYPGNGWDLDFTGYTLPSGQALPIGNEHRIDVPMPPQGSTSAPCVLTVTAYANDVLTDTKVINFTTTWSGVYPQYTVDIAPLNAEMPLGAMFFILTVTCNVPSPKDFILFVTVKDPSGGVLTSQGGYFFAKGYTIYTTRFGNGRQDVPSLAGKTATAEVSIVVI